MSTKNKFLRDFGMEKYTNREVRSAQPGRAEPMAEVCRNCGRSYTRIARHRKVCDRLPSIDELIRIFEEDETVSVEALTKRFGVSSQFIRDTLKYCGQEKYIGRSGVTRIQFKPTPESETPERCKRCKIKVFDNVPDYWKGEGMEKIGNLCAWCARIDENEHSI